MTADEIALIQTSWAKVEPISDTAAKLFYDKLFETAPSVRPLFKGDMDEQGRKLMAMLGLVVKGLPKLPEIVPNVQALGRRHAGYGAEPAHYQVVGATLLWTLGQGLGDDFTPETEAAWAAAYGVLADTMIAAQEQQQAA
jgi:hemoglobin-like flavoprotein